MSFGIKDTTKDLCIVTAFIQRDTQDWTKVLRGWKVTFTFLACEKDLHSNVKPSIRSCFLVPNPESLHLNITKEVKNVVHEDKMDCLHASRAAGHKVENKACQSTTR